MTAKKIRFDSIGRTKARADLSPHPIDKRHTLRIQPIQPTPPLGARNRTAFIPTRVFKLSSFNRICETIAGNGPAFSRA
jgi:hypothetical protein